MIIEAEVLDLTRYAVQYELLRTEVTAPQLAWGSEAGEPPGTGLALLLREGMPGWLKAVECVLRASLARRASETRAGGAQPLPDTPVPSIAAPMTLSSAQRHDLARLLASLVLSTRPLAGLSPREGTRPCQ